MIVTGRSADRCFSALRSDTILATNKRPPKVAANDTGIVLGQRNENIVRATETTKSRLLKGVTGGTDFGFFVRRQSGFFAPGTGSPQM